MAKSSSASALLAYAFFLGDARRVPGAALELVLGACLVQDFDAQHAVRVGDDLVLWVLLGDQLAQGSFIVVPHAALLGEVEDRHEGTLHEALAEGLFAMLQELFDVDVPLGLQLELLLNHVGTELPKRVVDDLLLLLLA